VRGADWRRLAPEQQGRQRAHRGNNEQERKHGSVEERHHSHDLERQHAGDDRYCQPGIDGNPYHADDSQGDRRRELGHQAC
jgi:hypothetical protein